MHSDSMPLCLHIGLAKTATTTLQRTLFRKHQQIRYFGQYVPSSVSMLCENEDVYRILRPLLWDTEEPLDADEVRKVLYKTILPKSTIQKCLVASWEGLANRGLEKNLAMMQRVQSVFGGCKILLTLRNPLTRLPSEYIENLKGHFIKGVYPWMGRDPFISIDQWLERAELHGHFQNMISYGQTLQNAVKLLGREHVGVFLFEELNEAPLDFYTKICGFLDVDVAEGLALTNDQHLHPRRTQGEIEFLRSLNKSPLRKRLLPFFSGKSRRAILERHSDGKPAESPQLSQYWAGRIISETHRWHHWLSETFDLPLAKYGYPITGDSNQSNDTLGTKVPQ